MRPTLILFIILFLIALVATGGWFYLVGKGRAASLGHQVDAIDPPIFVLITAGMAFLGERVLIAYTPVLLLRQQARQLRRRIKLESKTVAENQQWIIKVEQQGFWHRNNRARNRAIYDIVRDHAAAERKRREESDRTNT